MPRPRALSDQAIREIRAARKYVGPFKRSRISLAALAHRYNVSVPLISKTLAHKVAYAGKAAPSDVVKPANYLGRRDPKKAPVRRGSWTVEMLEFARLEIVCVPAQKTHFLVASDAVEAFCTRYGGVKGCEHVLPEKAVAKLNIEWSQAA